MSQFKRDQVQDMYYLSPMQEGMLFHTLHHQEKGFYVEQMDMNVKGTLRYDLLEKSMNIIVERYDIFRTVFLHEKVKRPVQVVLKERPFTLDVVDLQDLSEDEQLERIEKFKQQDQLRGFDLSKDSLMRASVFQTGPASYRWIWSYHHILLDGWCFGLVVQELFAIYHALLHDVPYKLTPVKPYKEYIKWLEKQDKQASLQYWQQSLAGFDGQSTFKEQRKQTNEHELGEIEWSMSKEETAALSELALQQNATLSSALQSVWSVLLSRYQRSNDVLFGTVVSGRPADLAGVDRMVGLFINVIPRRIQLTDHMTFRALLSETQQQSLAAEPHQYIPIYDIQAKTGQQQLIDHIVVFENVPAAKKDEQEARLGFTVEDMNVYEKSNYDLNLLASPGEELLLKLAFNQRAFDPQFVHKLKEQLSLLINEAVKHPDQSVHTLPLVTKQEKQLILEEWNAPELEHDQLYLSKWFEHNVRKQPNAVALSAEEQTMTYAELNEQANRLARHLQKNGAEHQTVIAILADRTPELIVSLLAVLKAGAAYVPIDPDYPESRIQYMLKDSGATHLLTHSSFIGQAKGLAFDGTYLFADDQEISLMSSENLPLEAGLHDTAYIMYTSGTTGQPKGIMTTHSNIARVVKNTNYLTISETDTLLSLSNSVFDGFTFDVYGALLNGAKLVLPKKDTILDMHELTELIKRESISVMFVPTALFNLLIDEETDWMRSVRKVLFGGERASVQHVRKAFDVMGKGRLINVYGPTESTVFATYYSVDEAPPIEAYSIPIGKPINQTGAYILSQQGQLQPIGMVGELCLSGKGLAKGYLNRPDLTKEAFITHPFAAGERLYRTGDLAYFRADGLIEYAGRVDDQVKIRGHRIELTEIEAHLLMHPGVKQAALITDQHGSSQHTRLLAYMTCEDEWKDKVDVIKSGLKEKLPAYMQPHELIRLEKMPLTPNGKVDKRQLPKPEAPQGNRHVKLPANEVEQKLLVMWCEVLERDDISTDDHFFEIGGHSLKAMSLLSKVSKEFDVQVPIHLLFETPTIEAISRYIQQQDHEAAGYLVFNESQTSTVFALPPLPGYGFIYQEAAKTLDSVRLIAFDFIEADHRMTQYVHHIQHLQPEGPLTLMGYSGGCYLAFELVQSLEQAGRTVEKVIMIDSYKKIGESDLEGRSIDDDIAAIVHQSKQSELAQEELVQEALAQKTRAYYETFVKGVNQGKIQADIDFIQSEEQIEIPDWMDHWEEATTGAYRYYQGYGEHADMFKNKECAAQNAQLIQKIINQKNREAVL
ncbi:nonribosomal peptide synthetase subunit [Bacillus safensis FO-36b]|uniref:non-ribosomal peptide synthetase n=1 Tax=Bacillus safensis TaxID=561879 RepID=UPI00045C4F2D|nr:non-ribosomal peptide synthetase [Bacillus safensis]MBY0189746.1 non-ribosomal peptide synthetase [Bacillus aerophilus]AWI35518.1 non-ribosomal peptide synthetase [Bacillus safensis FO-36b]KDE25688.1 nonribosomal peptide synthetase subunit [Bacillus safensis FO-36b]MCM3049920.1 non-ribosomal peptide synthetase [Bacillus safensis]MEC1047786.1 non-ribosomal peptide synthetase [Bacillus safensis]